MIKKKGMRCFVMTFLICFFYTITAFAQLGKNPSSLQWYQIDTDSVQVIFPEGMDVTAQRVSNLIHFLYQKDQSIGSYRGKVSIILQNQGVISNGFVAVGPFRSEFFTIAPSFSFNGTTDWNDLLGIHEYRHVLQYENATVGVSKWMSYLFGDFGQGISTGMAIPNWFWEGDAVRTETDYSLSGRGRVSNFVKDYRTVLLSGKNYNYEKASAGSFKDFVPNHYHLGYWMVSYGRELGGENLWKEVLHDAGAYNFPFYGFSYALEKRTGMGTRKFYMATMDSLRTYWGETYRPENLSVSLRLNNRDRNVIRNYMFPEYGDGQLYVMRSGYDEIPGIYQLDLKTGKEKLICRPGTTSRLNAGMSYSKGKLVWAEFAYHERWSQKSYSVIKLHNSVTGKTEQLTYKSRYFSPELSHQGNQIITVENEANGLSRLVLLDAQSGNVLKELVLDAASFLRFPVFSEDDQHISFVVQKSHQNALMQWDLSTGETKYVSDFSSQIISYITENNGYIYYAGSYESVGEIYALELASGKHYKVTRSAFEATQPELGEDGNLYYADFSIKGYNIKQLKLNKNRWEILSNTFENPFPFISSKSSTIDNNLPSEVPNNTYQSKPYKNRKQLLKIHSWSPWVRENEYGFMVFNNDLMSDISLKASFYHNRNDETNTYEIGGLYGKWYPAISVTYKRTKASARTFLVGDRSASQPIFYENTFQAGVVLPLNISHDNYLGSLSLGTYIERSTLDFSTASPIDFDALNSFRIELDVLHLQQRERRQYTGRFGQQLQLSFVKSMDAGNAPAEQLMVDYKWYLPGLLRTHSLQLSAGYQKDMLDGAYRYENTFRYARGYQYDLGRYVIENREIDFLAATHNEVNVLRLDYGMPLFFPDIALRGTLFVRAIRMNLFYDYAELRSPYIDDVLVNRSAGFDLLMDARWFRLQDITIGFRYANLIDGLAVKENFSLLLALPFQL